MATAKKTNSNATETPIRATGRLVRKGQKMEVTLHYANGDTFVSLKAGSTERRFVNVYAFGTVTGTAKRSKYGEWALANKGFVPMTNAQIEKKIDNKATVTYYQTLTFAYTAKPRAIGHNEYHGPAYPTAGTQNAVGAGANAYGFGCVVVLPIIMADATAPVETETTTRKTIGNVFGAFDGISCGSVALGRAGVEYKKYYSSEIDETATGIAKNNNPGIVFVGDITKLTDDQLREMEIDLLLGGSPCTDLSQIGKRAGLSTVDGVLVDSLEKYLELKTDGVQFVGQSFLFWEYMRVLRVAKPRFFLLENNRMSADNIDIFNRSLGVSPFKINSSIVSAQSRNRLYWTNICDKIEIADRGVVLQSILETGTAHREKSKCVRVGGRGSNDRHEWDKADTTGRRYTPVELERLQTLPDNYTAGVSVAKRYKALGNCWTVDIIVEILKNL